MPAPDLTMAPDVRTAFLAEERVVRLATVDDDRWPIVVPLWFVHHPDPRGEIWVWNLNRARRTARLDAQDRCGITIDAGHDYHELRGVTARATPSRVADEDVPLEVLTAYAKKYHGGDGDQPHPFAHHHTWFALALSGERSWDFRRIGS